MVERQKYRFKVKRPLWLKIRNRLLYYRPHARVFPWYCATCTLSSRFLSVILDHSCPNKNMSRHVQDFSNEQRIALLGFRSKAKDALAVMERVTNPQTIDLGRVGFPLEDSELVDERINAVPRLSEICLAALKVTGSTARQFQTESMNPPFQVKQGSYRYRHQKQTGQLCTVCQQLFNSFLDYEAHLRDANCANETPPDPVPIHMSDSGNVPSNYHFAPHRRPVEKPRLMICSLCLDDRFATTEQFHEHIIDCARKLSLCGEVLSYGKQPAIR